MRHVIRAHTLLALVLLGCSSPNEPTSETDQLAQSPLPDIKTAKPDVQFASLARAFQDRADIAGTAMQAACQPLGSAVTAFLDSVETGLQSEAQAVWHDCYEHWQAFSLFHQVAFNPAAQEALDRSRRLINVRPFLPGYVDALPEYPYSGLVHETGMDLTLDNLLEQHQLMDLESPALGFPVVETLLWQSDPDTYWLTSGGDGDLTITRRHQYLSLATDHLLQQLEQARLRWAGQVGFTGLPEPAQRRIVLTSLEHQVRDDLLALTFTDDALQEPDWHHPSLVAGQGKRHLQARLAGLEALFASPDDSISAFSSWLDRLGGAVTSETLGNQIVSAREALNALPDNTPTTESDAEAWQAAVVAFTGLADLISQLRAAQ
ncbi:imelysin family protein [Saccharospirillum impatiens]|uniref:imelysin family protein n=1 Tax=Saccharospirillum impatiens TaxID=169438 RepID=UPI00041A3192|nr:imelysin family protein [Saccharospirillum impatiens]